MLGAQGLRQRGFSLIELVVAMAVLVLLAAALVPDMSTSIRSLAVRNAADSLQAGLQKARMEALRRNRAVGFWLVSANASGGLDSACAAASSSASWIISVDDPAGKCDVAPSATAAPRLIEAASAGKANPTLSIAALQTDGSTAATGVSFDGYGRVVQNGASIATIDLEPVGFANGVHRLRVSVSPAGGIRMCDRDVTASDPRAC